MTHIVVQTLLGLSKERPVVFIIDDLHWIDNISFKLFKGILDENKPINKIFILFLLQEIILIMKMILKDILLQTII